MDWFAVDKSQNKICCGLKMASSSFSNPMIISRGSSPVPTAAYSQATFGNTSNYPPFGSSTSKSSFQSQTPTFGSSFSKTSFQSQTPTFGSSFSKNTIPQQSFPFSTLVSPGFSVAKTTVTIPTEHVTPAGVIMPAPYEIIQNDDRLIKSIPLAPNRPSMSLKPIDLEAMGVPVTSIVYNLYSNIHNEFSVGIAFCSDAELRNFATSKNFMFVNNETCNGYYQNQLSNIENHRYLTCAISGVLLPSIATEEHNLTTVCSKVTIFHLMYENKYCLGVVIE
jgi:hypothetical protein